MIIDTKYDVGDKVKYNRRTYKTQTYKCSFCDGTGEITGMDGTVRECPNCEGNTYLASVEISNKTKVGVISGVNVIHRSDMDTSYIWFDIDEDYINHVELEDIISLQ